MCARAFYEFEIEREKSFSHRELVSSAQTNWPQFFSFMFSLEIMSQSHFFVIDELDKIYYVSVVVLLFVGDVSE